VSGDEGWRNLIHVEIEALAGRILDSIAKAQIGLSTRELTIVNDALWAIAGAVNDQVKTLRRIPEKMDPALYYKTFRPYAPQSALKMSGPPTGGD
jgi:indoleamine 2,3-dioxygenase